MLHHIVSELANLYLYYTSSELSLSLPHFFLFCFFFSRSSRVPLGHSLVYKANDYLLFNIMISLGYNCFFFWKFLITPCVSRCSLAYRLTFTTCSYFVCLNAFFSFYYYYFPFFFPHATRGRTRLDGSPPRVSATTRARYRNNSTTSSNVKIIIITL